MGTIAVFGGSFDPLTLAHEKIITRALDDLNAERGIVVPCSDEYIKNKKGSYPMFPADTRLKMLRCAFSADSRITIDPREVIINSPEGRTLLTMKELKALYPGRQLIFVTGADKLETLPRWGGGMFLREFQAAVYPRQGVSAQPVNGVIMLPSIPGTEGISSGAVKKLICEGSDIAKYVSTAVYRIVNETEMLK